MAVAAELVRRHLARCTKPDRCPETTTARPFPGRKCQQCLIEATPENSLFFACSPGQYACRDCVNDDFEFHFLKLTAVQVA